ncbi:MAG: T9SS type A sorting domain-containing protein [Chitinophagales bacterium]
MRTLLKITFTSLLFISQLHSFSSGWQQKLDLINSSERANNSEIAMMANGDCIIASTFAQPWDSSVYLHQYKKADGELKLFNINYIFNKYIQKINAIKYLPSIQKYILIYEESKPYVVPYVNNKIYYHIIDSFEPFVMQPRHVLYTFTNNDLYSNKLVVTETDSTIEAGFSTVRIDNVNNHVCDTISFRRAAISFSNLDTVARIDSVIIPQKYNSANIQYGLYFTKKVQNDYILNLSNLDTFNRYYAKLIQVHANLTWDSVAVYYPNGFISPQLLNNGNLLIKNNFRGTMNGNDGYTTTDVYNSNLEKLFSIDSTSLPGNAAIYLEPKDGTVINIEGDYYPNQPAEYGMVKEIIDINNRKPKKQEVWHINYPDGISYRNFNIVSQTEFKDGYAYLYGLIAGPNNRNLYLIQIDSLGNVYNNLIRGNIIGDMNNNCVEDQDTDVRMRNMTVTANIDTNILFTSTDHDGYYQFATNYSGTAKVAPRNNFRYPLWTRGACSDTATIQLSTDVSVDSVNFNFTPILICSNLNISVQLKRFRHLLDSVYYYIDYCNTGTKNASNAYIDLSIDPLLTIDGATTSGGMPVTIMNLGSHRYRLFIGVADIFDCGRLIVKLHEAAEATLGRTVCIESHIYPDSVCMEATYTGSVITASATCLGDSVELQLKNNGGNMQQSKKYIVIEDQVIRKASSYSLPSNGILTEKFPADSGKTYRIVAEQEDVFPRELGEKFVTAFIEGCRPNDQVHVSTGNVMPFSNYNAPYRATACQVIVGSFDPNAKEAMPLGYGVQHFIEANTTINYTIHFQNTGNDTAYTVVVVDTISNALDINTLVPQVSSHTYRFERADSNVVRFVFDSIYLVDSVHNEPLSHGFVQFSIQQKTDNPIGTKIYNDASIYFDRNEAVITNKVFHTIGKDFIEVRLLSSTKNTKYNVKEVTVFPNPFRDKTQIIVKSDELRNPVLLLMNLNGQIIKTIESSGINTFDIYREDLSSGMYLFRILENNEEVTTGKLLAQ